MPNTEGNQSAWIIPANNSENNVHICNSLTKLLMSCWLSASLSSFYSCVTCIGSQSAFSSGGCACVWLALLGVNLRYANAITTLEMRKGHRDKVNQNALLCVDTFPALLNISLRICEKQPGFGRKFQNCYLSTVRGIINNEKICSRIRMWTMTGSFYSELPNYVRMLSSSNAVHQWAIKGYTVVGCQLIG